MPANLMNANDREECLDKVVVAYLEALEGGQAPDRQEWLGQYPDLADELARFFASHDRFARLAVPLQAAVECPDRYGPQLGDFRIIRELGRGGMGVVYEAEQISLGRKVALKVLPFASAMDSKQLQRFKNEAQAAAHLHHTNIVPVYAVGSERGVHYYAMQLIDGQTLAAMIAGLRVARPESSKGVAGLQETRITPFEDSGRATQPCPETLPVAAASTAHSAKDPAYYRTAANLGVQAAEALEHAHQLGVIHRDIKPGNLLVDGRGNLWITDFGLARLGTDAGLTMSGDLLGTLRYMSPEQALAKRVIVDHRTDIYSLGVTLYELLTLQPAFTGKDRQEILRQIAFEEPKPPRRLNRTVPPELETIVLKAIEKKPEERYATVQELADDLRRFLEDRPIRARRPTLTQRARKWTRRHQPAVWSAAAAFFAVLIVTMSALAWNNAAIKRERDILLIERQDLELINFVTRLDAAEQKALARTPAGIVAAALDYLDQFGPASRETLTIRGHTGACAGLAYSPDGRYVVTASYYGGDYGLRVWDAATGKEIEKWPYAGNVLSAAFSDDGRLFAFSSVGHTKVFDWTTRQELATLAGHELGRARTHGTSQALVWNIAFRPRSHELVTAAGDGQVIVWNAAAGESRLILDGYFAAVYSPDGRYLATKSHLFGPEREMVVKIHDADTGRELVRLQRHMANIHGLAFSPDSRRIASGGSDKWVRVSDVAMGKEVLVLAGHEESVYAVVFSPDGRWLASGSIDGTVKIWDAQTGREMRTLNGNFGPIWRLAFSPDGSQLAAAGGVRYKFGAAKIWKTKLWDGHPTK